MYFNFISSITFLVRIFFPISTLGNKKPIFIEVLLFSFMVSIFMNLKFIYLSHVLVSQICIIIEHIVEQSFAHKQFYPLNENTTEIETSKHGTNLLPDKELPFYETAQKQKSSVPLMAKCVVALSSDYEASRPPLRTIIITTTKTYKSFLGCYVCMICVYILVVYA